ncbi:MAG: hypothetical protein A2Y38_02690 [Spirochaetes bacterium GWB1_59_5]|nr:MAG: hypothetical protein A2Y38_02690 [Spirochaetes bacterium GWB1_59_5]
MDVQDIVGKHWGRITVTRFLRQEPYKDRYNYWYECQCDCGHVVEKHRVNLLTEHVQSCGCLKHRVGNTNPTWNGCGEISGWFWSHIRHQARTRGLPFEITAEDAWALYGAQQGLCALTGWPLKLDTHKHKEGWKTASLDRIDSAKGYVLGNIQWVHKDINRIKMNFTQARFLELCQAVTGHHNGRV